MQSGKSAVTMLLIRVSQSNKCESYGTVFLKYAKYSWNGTFIMCSFRHDEMRYRGLI